MTSQGTAHGRFQRAIAARNLVNAETAARETGGLSLSARTLSTAHSSGAMTRVGQLLVHVRVVA
jgi:hypothetical protein